jgi:transcriptional regulator with GAF, ATPase, and Fis domain
MASQSFAPSIWLHNPLNGRCNGYIQSIADEFHQAQISFSVDSPEKCETATVVLFDETTAEAETPECLCELLSDGRHIIVVYTGEKPLPFYRTWQWLGMGVEDVLSLREKTRLGEIVKSRLQRWTAIDRIMDSDRVKNKLIGNCPIWKKTLRQVVEMACFSSAPVLILGESGTGKELISRLIHDLDKRPGKQDLVLLDCTTIVPELSGSEFFGHEKGAFTNAISNRDGAFALANRGTLFLDEIGELPMRLQAELLRVSQEGLYKRVGSNMWKETQFRLVSATNRNLLNEVEKGNFRQDLYYRIRTCAIQLPSLRERKLDIPDLAAFFLGQELKTDAPPPFSKEVQQYLMTRNFPGNVRELKQLMARIAYRHCGNGPITLGDIPPADRDTSLFPQHGWQENGFRDAIRQAIADGVGLKDIKRVASDVAMTLAIEEAGGNLQEAATRLDVSDRLVQGFWAERRR